MRRILLVLFALVFVLSSCAEKEIPKETEKPEETSNYDMLGDTESKKPSAGNYYIYTPVIDVFTPKTEGEISFLDFDGTKFIMDSGTDKAFLLSYDLFDGKTENLTDKLGFHSEHVFFDGKNFCSIEDDGYEYYLVLRNSEGEMTEKIRTRTEEAEYGENYVLPEVDFDFFRSGEKIILIKCYEDGGINTYCYDFETREIIEHHKNLALSGHKTIPANGYVTYAEENNGLFTLFAFEPEKDKKPFRGPVLTEKVICSTFDGTNFVWSTESGIFYRPSFGKTVQISEQEENFALLGRNFVVYSTGEKLALYRLDKNREGCYSYSGLEFVYADESIAVFKNPEGIFGEEYLSVSIKRGEEPLELADAADMGPSTVAVDGYLYYCFFEGSGVVPTERQISGKINSLWDYPSTCPRKNDQTSDSWFFGARYAFVDGNLLLENINGKGWYKCEKSWALSEMNFN